MAPAQLALAGGASAPVDAPRRPVGRARGPRPTRADFFARIAVSRLTTFCLAAGLLGGAFFYGAVQGGAYDRFVAENGAPADLIARGLGFGLDSVTIAGARELVDDEILAAAGVSGKNSLLFLNAAEVRERLLKVPMVREASVRKLYPGRLLLDVTEREPNAIWQKDGLLMVVAADGTAIEEARDGRFAELPFVVGAGANKRVAEFQSIVAAAPDMGLRVRAGVLVSERRWNIRMTNGVDVKLPEKDAAAAFAAFAKLAREQRLLEKDILSVDFRMSGRVFVRLAEEAAATRAENLARKKGKGGAT